jgi:hypothetical protein
MLLGGLCWTQSADPGVCWKDRDIFVWWTQSTGNHGAMVDFVHLSAFGRDLRCSFTLRLVSINSFVDTSNPTTVTNTGSITQIRLKRQAVPIAGIPSSVGN